MLAGYKMKITILTSNELKIYIIIPCQQNILLSMSSWPSSNSSSQKENDYNPHKSDIDYGQGAEQTAAGAANPAEEEPRQDRWGCPAAGGGIVAGVGVKDVVDAQQMEVALVLMLLLVLTLKILSIAEDAQQQVEGCRCQCWCWCWERREHFVSPHHRSPMA